MEPTRRSKANGREVIVLRHWNLLPAPVFILGLPRSFTSLACAMLGQHPQLYGLPETHLFPFETLGARAACAARETYPMTHGLLRAVAQLYFEGQTQAAVRKARRWLQAQSSLSTVFLFKVLADRVFPRALVEKSPSSIYRQEILERMWACFPQARFIHLVRHPQGYGNSVMRYIQERAKHGSIPPAHWLFRISCYPPPIVPREGGKQSADLDPQNGWYALHKLIGNFLQSLPADRRMRVKGEDLLAEPERVLRDISAWIGIRTDCGAIERMKHPERSPYAFLGPPEARYGNDAFFLQHPNLRPDRAADSLSLEGPLEWRNNGAGFYPEVKLLAKEFGYR